MEHFIFLACIVLYVTLYLYALHIRYHITETREHARINDSLYIKKISFKEFLKLFHQKLWEKDKRLKYRFTQPKGKSAEEILGNRICIHTITINCISYRLPWYSYWLFLIWTFKKYKPNPNLLMAYL